MIQLLGHKVLFLFGFIVEGPLQGKYIGVRIIFDKGPLQGKCSGVFGSSSVSADSATLIITELSSQKEQECYVEQKDCMDKLNSSTPKTVCQGTASSA